MIKKNIKSCPSVAAGLREEKGFTLVEILVAVSILSIISVSFMGYFMTAMERSADNHHRVIAANLARLKAEELKESFRAELPAGSSYRNKFEHLAHAMSENSSYKVTRDTASTGGEPAKLFEGLLDPFNPVDSYTGTIDTTLYRYQVEVSSKQLDRLQLLRTANAGIFQFRTQEALIRMVVTVYWGAADDGSPSAFKSVVLDTYLVGS
ncbi:hypothetical protein D3C78_1080010 [compost metagenome]